MLVIRLAVSNNFLSTSDSHDAKVQRGSENTWMSNETQREYIRMLYEQANITTDFVYIKHMNFVDFGRFGYATPIYVNLVRHPIERVVSWYYYIRQGWYNVRKDEQTNQTSLRPEGLAGRGDINGLKSTFEDCLIKNKPECTYRPGQSCHYSPYGGSHYSQVEWFINSGSSVLICV